ncbi:MAG: NADH-quinone oxidoreductase subunit NuoH [Gemmatimonadota bacterium]|nr:NADH-quinone oxidoreductase subunit NuoH [Gemmatimonadota bacterium]
MITGPVSSLLQTAVPGTPSQSFGAWLVATLVKMIVVFTVYMVGVALLTLAERKISAWIQGRLGPNRVGPGGLLQPAADGLKNIMKEETYPEQAYMPLFVLAPAMSFIPALVTWAVIPFGAPWDSPWGRIDMALAPLPIGFLYILAISSLGVYGIVLAGWSSNNKYSLLGGLRASAQMVSYEVAMGMSTIPVLLLAGNVALDGVIAQQAAMGWNVLTLTLAFFIFMIAAFAETNRLPFDLPEAESELIAGYHSEYSAMKFSFFFIAEYANMVTASALMATLFFGGWDIPFVAWDNVAPHTGLKTILTGLTFLVKILFFIFLFMWIRWTLPRFRYDQLMALGWKILIPLSLTYIVIVAGVVLVLDAIGVPRGWMFGAALFGVNVVIMLLVVLGLDRGRVVSPATTRVGTGDIERLQAARVRQARRTAPAEVGD